MTSTSMNTDHPSIEDVLGAGPAFLMNVDQGSSLSAIPTEKTDEPADQWRLIETHDGSADPVDILYPERGRLTDAVLRGKAWGREEWRGSHTVWFVPSEKPSHWMPLPAAPAAIAQAQQVTHD